MWNSRFYEPYHQDFCGADSGGETDSLRGGSRSHLCADSRRMSSRSSSPLSAEDFVSVDNAVGTSANRYEKADPALRAQEGEQIEELIPNIPWPGSSLMENTDQVRPSWIESVDQVASNMKFSQPKEEVEEEEANLFEIIQSAKTVLPEKRSHTKKRTSSRSIKLRLNDNPKVIHDSAVNGDSGLETEALAERDDMDTPDPFAVPVLGQSHGDPSTSPPYGRRKRWGNRRADTGLSANDALNGEATPPKSPVKKKRAKKKKPTAASPERRPVVLPHLNQRYLRPEKSKVKREYRQLWNEKGKLSKKNTEYLEVHYENYLPDKEDIKLKPTHYTHNHKNGKHWEVRYRTPLEKAAPPLQKVERIWENEFQMFKLNKLFDKQLNMSL